MTSASRGEPSTSRRALLRNRSLLALLARDVVSLTGSQMTWLALPWFVLTTTGSASRMAVVLAVESASLAVFGFLGGNIVARLGPRRTMPVADAARAPLVALVPLLHALDALSFPLLLVLVAAISAFITPSFASKTSILPDLVGEDEAVLGEANALLQGANRITLILGPALAGALIAVIGATNVLLIDAVTFAAGFTLIGLFVRGGGRVEQDDESRSLLAGLRFIARDRLLRPWVRLAVMPAAVSAGAMLFSGRASGRGSAPLNSVGLVRTPGARRAKVWSVFVVLTSVFGPAALLGAGPALEHAGVTPVLMTVFVVQSIAAMAFAGAGLRERGRATPAVAASATPHVAITGEPPAAGPLEPLPGRAVDPSPAAPD